MKLPIRARMTIWYVALLALIIAAVGSFLVLRLRADLMASLDGRLRSAAEQIALGYHAEGAPEARDVSATVLSGERAASQVLTPAGRVVASYGDRAARAPLLGPADLRRVAAGARVRGTAAGGLRVAARATTRGAYRRVVVAAASTAGVERTVHRLLVLLLLAGPAAVAATALGGWWLARRALRPVDRLTAQAAEIGIDRLSERLPVPSTGDEVERLAATLNAMLARVQAGVDEQHRLVADASHELRTPLAAMRAELEVSLLADELGPDAREVLGSALDEVVRLSAVVDGLLTLARADRGALDLRAGDVDLAAVAAATVERLRLLAAVQGVTIDAELEPAPARGDAALLGQAVANLVDNAVRHSPAGAAVTVTTGAAGDEALVRVLDEGPGIGPEDRERVFDRFHRLDASRARETGGAGIGLSIVREVARAHGGRAWTEPGDRGGSVFALALPRAGAQRSRSPTGNTRDGGDRQGGATMRRVILPLLAALVAAATTAALAVAHNDGPGRSYGHEGSYAIGLWGDLPYNELQKTVGVPNLIADMNRQRLAFTAHDGDLKAGSGPCPDSLYTDAKASFDTLDAPAIFTPGDNDWTDCDRNPGVSSSERLDFERKVLFSTAFTLGRHRLRQEVQAAPYVENRRWTYGGVTYATLNVQGSCNNLCDTAPDPAEYAARNTADIAWLHATFAEAKTRRAAAVMIIWQADPGWDATDATRAPARDPKTLVQSGTDPDGYHDILSALRDDTIAFQRPVAVVQGDSHYFRIDKPFLDAQGRRLENFTRVETFGDHQENGDNDVNWVRVEVDPHSREVFSYQPQIVPGNRTAVPAPTR